MNCNCDAYEFPHRPNGGKCQSQTLIDMAYGAGYDMYQEDAEIYLADFGNDVHVAFRGFIEDMKTPHPASVYY